jgi:hypothetical protein
MARHPDIGRAERHRLALALQSASVDTEDLSKALAS